MINHIPVILYGVGGVGRALLRQILNGRSVIAERNRIQFNIVALADSRNWQSDLDGLKEEQIQTILNAKEQGRPWGEDRPSNLEILNLLQAVGLPSALVVDVTAQDDMEPVIDQALAYGYGVVLANKKPLAEPWETAAHYYNNPQVRHESTVGGGQPVIATLRYLLDTNDPPDLIEGQLSGTLGYICGRLEDGAPFSTALSEAKAKGYTEPDPREDLGGMDVMRKVMILGRMAGWPLETADIEVEALYPSHLADLPVSDFMQAITEMDASLRERVEAARTAGKVLRYTAEVTAQGGSVGLKPIPRESPLAHLKYISFRTNHYSDQPMMIGGKGAGVEMTAAGVLGDMIGLAREGSW
jgi:homoserine dehydrogenase